MKRLSSPAHLQRVRLLPCLVCGSSHSTEAHHLLRGVVRGMGRKADDSKVIPLCSRHHRDLHQDGNETTYLARYGIINPVAVADALYTASPDLEAMEDILGRAAA